MRLLDTTFLIHYWGGVEAVREYLKTHEEETFVTTTLNLKEIAVGRKRQGALDRAEIRSTFDWVKVVPFESDHAFVAGELEAVLHESDHAFVAGELEAVLHESDAVNQDRINALAGDVLIAAVAKERNATVVTRNVDGFKRFDGVAVDTY